MSRVRLFPINWTNQPLTEDDVRIDDVSVPLVPSDCCDSLVPIRICADGNCLPRCASMFSYHTEEFHEELRYRIIVELVRNAEFYLSSQLDEGGKTKSAEAFAMFSECFTGLSFTKKTVAAIFREEVLSIIRGGTYMGAWQLAALPNIINCPVRSVYPEYAGVTARPHLHRFFYPTGKNPNKAASKNNGLAILWTHTQGVNLSPKEWYPNHFAMLIER